MSAPFELTERGLSACPRRATFAEGDALAHGDHVGRRGDAHHIAPLPRPGSGPCKHGRSRFPTPAHLVAWGERWPAPLDAAAAWRALAQDAPRASGAVAVRVGQPSICPVPACDRLAGPRRRWWRWPRPYSPPSTSCLPGVSPIAILGRPLQPHRSGAHGRRPYQKPQAARLHGHNHANEP